MCGSAEPPSAPAQPALLLVQVLASVSAHAAALRCRLVRGRVPGCNDGARIARWWAELGAEGASAAVTGWPHCSQLVRARFATFFRVPPRSMYHARPRRAVGGAAGRGAGAAVWVQCFLNCSFLVQGHFDATRPSRQFLSTSIRK